MIVFDLKCANAHVFEAWFANGAAFEEQVASDRVRCPICDDPRVAKAVMAPHIPAKGNSRAPFDPKLAMQALAAAQAKMLQGSEWVGSAFSERARAMHDGVEAHAPIHGQASLAEAKALVDEGVPVAPLPLPVTPPKALN